MTCLITGANGFIGRHCVAALQDIGVPTLPSGRNNKKLYKNFVTVDICDHSAVSAVIMHYRPTHLIHLAWLTTEDYASSPSNIQHLAASIHLLHTFYAHGGQRFVGAGTCFEYALSEQACCEKTSLTTPQTLYGKAKLAFAQYLDAYSTAHGYSAAWGRPFYILGPGENPRRLIPSACKSLRHGETFATAACENTLDYMDVRDVARAFVHIAYSPITGPINIASGSAIRIYDMLTLLAQLAGKPDAIRCSVPRQKPIRICADIHLLRDVLNFAPQFTIQHSLQDCLADYDSHAIVQ